MHEAFARAIAEGGYRGQYRGVFPIKVNQRQEVVAQILRAGRPYDYGLEVGSKPELATALALHDNPHALLICNGLKDETFIQLALYGRMLGKVVILVLENLGELEGIIRAVKHMRIKPLLGIRVKLFSRGSGKWEEGGGELLEFGLQIGEVLQAIEMLTHHGLRDSLKMLHFHLGSQVTDIRRIKNAVREAARIYAKLYKSGVELEYLNVGGGLGIDYDGSQTPSDSSINYTVQEYANNVVYTIKEICEQEGTRQPTIVSESGRAVVAHHSLLVINVQRAVHPPQPFKDGNGVTEPSQVIVSLTELLDSTDAEKLSGVVSRRHRAAGGVILAVQPRIFEPRRLGPWRSPVLGRLSQGGALCSAGGGCLGRFPTAAEGLGLKIHLQFLGVSVGSRFLGHQATLPHHPDSTPE